MKCLQRAFHLKSFVVHPEHLKNKNIGAPNFRRSAASSSSLKSFIIIVFPPIISWHANFQLFHFSRSFIDMMQTIEVILIWLRLNRPWSKKYLSPVLERTIHIPVSQCNKGPEGCVFDDRNFFLSTRSTSKIKISELQTSADQRRHHHNWKVSLSLYSQR